MKSLQKPLLIFSILLPGIGLAQQASLSGTDRHSALSETAAQQDSPAQQRIAAAQLQIDRDPQKSQAYDEMAIALIRRAHETADPRFLKDADAALTQGLKLDPADFQLQKNQVALMLGRHEFVQARERAMALNRKTPDDVMTYGYIAEADIALGNYAEAETNAQWMMDMRPNNTPALLVGAKLRMSCGDAHGAIEFLNRAYSQTSPAEVGDLAWIANQIASIQIESGQTDAAEQTLAGAEQLFPQFPNTIENLARVRIAQNRAGDAVQLLKQATSIDHDPHVLYELAKAQEAEGETRETLATYAEFKQLNSVPGIATEESKLDLILMYAESPNTAPIALQLAQEEIRARQDVWTLDAYAWALYANAMFQEADAAVQKAIAVGIQSVQIFDHAGHIAQKLNRSADAVKYFTLSIKTNPASEFAADALKSATPVAMGEAREQKTTQRVPALDHLQPLAPLMSLSATDQPVRNEAPAAASTTNYSPVFAPVSTALLRPEPTGTDRLIYTAQASVALNPKDAAGYAGLGAAYFQRARETGDVSDYQMAEESLNKSLDLDSTDFSADAALGTMAEVCMGEHRFADALSFAQKALSLGTGDLSPFAIVGDAYADMGEYEKAAVAYGRLTPRDMTLSPRPAYARDSRLSFLRFIAGDTAAAIALMKKAVTEGVEAQLPSENMAWLHYELGEFETQAGDPASANAAYLAALEIHSGDYRALAALGKLRANNGRYQEAIELYQKAIAVVPMPVFVAELGDLYLTTGDKAEAKKQYALVEYIGLLGHINQVLHNRDLALFYADHDMKLAEALDLAQKELEVRHDVYTWDALAWALYKNGKLTEAASASEKAMRFGTRDSIILFHAGMIAEGLGRHEQARGDLKEALKINPSFHLIYASEAKQTLAALDTKAESEAIPNDLTR
jgi:tetratricopeptide (TPR) repeat protein